MTGNETLLDKAKSNLFQATILFRYRTEDESIINGVAYHLQQAVELALKHHLELSGIDYPKTHDIEILLRYLGEDFFPEIYPWAGTITLMESKTRYIKNYRASLRTVDAVFPLSKRLIEYIEAIDSEEPDPAADRDSENASCEQQFAIQQESERGESSCPLR